MSYSDNEPTVAAMERVIKQRDKLIEENERLHHSLHSVGVRNRAEREEWTNEYNKLVGELDQANAAIQTHSAYRESATARLSAAEEAVKDLLARLYDAEVVVEAMQHIAENGSGGPMLDWPTFAADVMARYKEGKK